MIRVEFVDVVARGCWRDEPLNLQLRAGECWRLEGEAGAGKSTVLALLAGAVRPESGQVERPRRQRCGVVLARGGLLSNQSLADNVALPLRIVAGLDRRRADARAKEHLERVGLVERAQSRPHAVTERERKWAQIARIDALRPELMVLDEPDAELDPMRGDGERLRQLVTEWSADSTRCIVSTCGDPRVLGPGFRRIRVSQGGLRRPDVSEQLELFAEVA